MTDLALASNSASFARVGFNFRLTQSQDEQIAQKLWIGLRTVLGEWYLNNTAGQPYFPGDDEKVTGVSTLTASMKRFILSVEGVDSLVSFDYKLNNQTRQFTVNFSARLTSGQVVSGSV